MKPEGVRDVDGHRYPCEHQSTRNRPNSTEEQAASLPSVGPRTHMFLEKISTVALPCGLHGDQNVQGPGRRMLPPLVVSSSLFHTFAPLSFHSISISFNLFQYPRTDNSNGTLLSRTERRAFHNLFGTAMASLQNIPYDLLLSIAQYLDLAGIYALQLVRMDGVVLSGRAISSSYLSTDLQICPLRDSHPTGLSRLGRQSTPPMPRAPAIRFQAPFRSIYGSASGGGESRSPAGTRLAHPHPTARCKCVCARRGRSIKRDY